MATPNRKKISLGRKAAAQTYTATGKSETQVGYEISNNGSANTIISGEGNDILNGNGKSTLNGGAGNDIYKISKAGDTITDSAGTDTVESSITGAAGYTLAADAENLTLTRSAGVGTGNSKNNVITGNRSNNTLTGGGGNDTINAGAGNDLIVVNGADLNGLVIDGGTGVNTVQINGTTNDLASVNLVNWQNVNSVKVGTSGSALTYTQFQNTVNSTAVVAQATAAAAALSTSNSTAAAQSTAAAAALSTTNSTAAAQSTAAAAALSTSNSTSVAQSTAASTALVSQQAQAALDNVNLAAGSNGIVSIVGGVSSNTAYAVGTGYSATLQGDTLGDAMTNHGYTNSRYVIDVSGATGSRNWYMVGGAATGGDNFIFNGGAQLGESTITHGGNTGADNIVLTGGVVTDGNFSKVGAGAWTVLAATSGATAVSFEVGSTAKAAGVSTLTGSTNADTFSVISSWGTTGVTIDGAAGNDTINFSSVTQLTNSDVTGSAGADTIAMTSDGVSVADSAFANHSTVDAFVTANGANTFTFGTNAQTAGIASVTGGTGNDSFGFVNGFDVAAGQTTAFYGLAGANVFTVQSGVTTSATFVGGADVDTFNIATATQLGAVSIAGGASNDVLNITLAATVVDADFVQVTSVETLNFTAASDVTYDVNGAAAGIVTINGSTAGDTFTTGVGATNSFTINAGDGADFITNGSTSGANLYGGAGNDTLSFASVGAFTTASVIDGGTGSNAVEFTGGLSVVDANFANIAAGTIQALYGVGGTSIVAGTRALAAGVSTLFGDASADNLNASAYGTNAVTLSGGGGADNLTGASSGANTFLFQNQVNFIASNATGGTSIDTIAFQNAVTIADADFGTYSGMDAVQLNGTAASTFEFGAFGSAAGITSVTGVGSGAVTFTLSSNTNAVTFVGGAGADQFIITGSNVFTAASISGGAGIDTLTFNTPDTVSSSIADSSFTRIAAGTIEVVTGTGATSITLGSNALAAGVTTVAVGSTNGVVDFNVGSGFGTAGISLSASAGTGSFNFVSTSQFANATLVGGAGTSDVINFDAAGTITSLANVTYVEEINLFGASSLTFQNGGVTGSNVLTITTGTGNSTINATGRTTGYLDLQGTSSGADTFTGGNQIDTLQGWSVGATSSVVDSLTGGAGADVFVIADNTHSGYDASAGWAVITDFGNGSDAIGVGSNNTGTFTVLTTVVAGGASYAFGINDQLGNMIAVGNYASSAAATNGISFVA